jgi:hypothetical protein
MMGSDARHSAMNPARWRRAFEIFHDAIAREADQRDAFLAAACPDDDEMCRAAEQLVSAHEAAGDFLEVPAAVPFFARTAVAGGACPERQRNSEKPAFSGNRPRKHMKSAVLEALIVMRPD